MIINPNRANNGGYGMIATPSECLSSFTSSGYLNVQQVLSSQTPVVNVAFAQITSSVSSNANAIAPVAINFYDPGNANMVIPNFVSSQS
jgi:hypothetical protein